MDLDDSVGSLKQLWPEWSDKIKKFAEIESQTRPAIRKLYEQLDQNDMENADGMYFKVERLGQPTCMYKIILI